jgi:tRNA pseudouridine32 synthase / 23S rRNA pseudouridine746 synthase
MKTTNPPPSKKPLLRPLQRHGVSASTHVLPALEHPPTLLVTYLADAMPLSGSQSWIQRMTAGLVLDQRGEPLTTNHPYKAFERLYYYRFIDHETPIPVTETVLYEDEHLLVADKPHFLPVTPKGKFLQETLLVRLRNKTGHVDLTPLHRLDRDTAGLVLFCKTPTVANAYFELFRLRKIRKVYEAWAGPIRQLSQVNDQFEYASHLETSINSFMQMQENPQLSHNSFTSITLLEAHNQFCRYQLEPQTGKRHQLRAQLNALGAPIVGDNIYPTLTAEKSADEFDYSAPLQLLAKQLRFIDPITGGQRQFTSQQTLMTIAQINQRKART